MSDRQAARAVIQEPGLPTMIVPIQTCAQVTMTGDFVERFKSDCCPGAAACAVYPKMWGQTKVMPWMVNRVVKERMPEGWPRSPGLDSGFIPWDVAALLALARPQLFASWEWQAASL